MDGNYKFFVMYTVSEKKTLGRQPLGEVGNETIASSQQISGIFLSKIIKIGKCLTKLRLMKDGDVSF